MEGMKQSSMRMRTDPGPTEPQTRRLHLLYHELRENKSGYAYIVTTQQFANHLALLRREDRNHADLRAEFTFDDGHLSDFEHALPLLASHRAQATFFITVGWTGARPGYMGWGELRALHQAGHSIGAHGWTHALLTHCSDAELDKELRSARLLLEDKLQTPITTMSFPGGRYDKRVLQACHQAGYTHFYTSQPAAYSSGNLIGRLNIRGSITDASLLELFDLHSSSLKNLARQHRLKASAQRLLGDRLYASLWALLNRKEPEAATTNA